MASYNFKNATANDVGTTPADVYTVPASKKSIMIGCSVTNITGATLPVELSLVKADSTIIHLSRAHRIEGGTTHDFLSGKKLVMQAGEKVQLVSKIASSLDCVVSVLEDVD
jgi:hypothetical protein